MAAPLARSAKATLALLAGISLAAVTTQAVFAKTIKPQKKTTAAVAASVSAMDSASTLPTVDVTNIVIDNDSAKIQFEPVAGAVDYRVYDLSNPTFVKYAGIRQNLAADKSTVTSAPALEVEWNGMTPGTTAELVVEAVGAVGPTSQGNLYDVNSSPLYPSMQNSMSMLGSDEGMTNDGMMTINGQGSYGDAPIAIARSLPFYVEPSGTPTLPSGTDATQVVYDTFTSGKFITTNANPDSDDLSTNYTLQSDAAWDILVRGADTTDTKPFVMGHHFMDVLFDGGTPGSNNPLHTTHGALALSPQQTADISGGKMLHITMEVDAHVNSRRWMGITLAPADDPVTSFYPSLDPTIHMNKTDQVFQLAIEPSSTVTTLFGLDSSGNNTTTPIAGAAGQAPDVNQRTMDGATNWNGRGLDDRSRIDLFITQSHYAEYEDGVLEGSYDIPGGLPFSAVKVYYVHYAYHSALGLQEEQTYTPYETDWINNVPYSDERHWDNMGYEVLPSTTSFNNLASRVGAPDPLNQTGASAVPATNPPNYSGSGGGGGTTPGDTTATVTGVITNLKTVSGLTATYMTVTPTTGSAVPVKTIETMVAAVGVADYTYATPVTVTYVISTNTEHNGKILSIVASK